MKKNKFFYGEHYEHLKYLWDSICADVKTLFTEKFDNIIKESVLLFDKSFSKTSYGVYLYNENYYFKILNIFKRKNSNINLVSSCPLLAGAKNKLILKKCHTWHSGVEGVFAARSATCNDLLLNFFDPFYIQDKELYNHNVKKNVYLSAVALNAQELIEEDHIYTEGNYYEHCLKEFLKNNPNKTEKDFTLKIQMRSEHFRMFVGRDTTCVYEIVGLIEDVKYTKILDKKTAVLKVNLEHREDNEFFYIYIYVSEHLLKKYKPKIGEGLHARVWLNGYFANEEMIEEKSIVLKDFWVLFIILTLFFALEIFSTKTNIYTVKPKPPQIEFKQEQIDFKRIK